jgi:hypothetical protein
VGIVSNRHNGSAVEFPGCDVHLIHEDAAIPERGFVVNAETPDEDVSGQEGVFTKRSKDRLESLWRSYVEHQRATLLFRSCYVEDVRGRQGTGPNAEMGGSGKSEGDRGIRFFFAWSREQLGRWEFPRHVK